MIDQDLLEASVSIDQCRNLNLAEPEAGGGRMTAQTLTDDYVERYEYHGNTSVEVTRSELGNVIKRDWILFDTVEDAQTFYFDLCCDGI